MVHDEIRAGQDRDAQGGGHREDVAVVVRVGELVGHRGHEEPEERHRPHERRGGRHENRHEDEDRDRGAPVVQAQVGGRLASEREDRQPPRESHEGDRRGCDERHRDREVLLLRVRDRPEEARGQHVELRGREKALHERRD